MKKDIDYYNNYIASYLKAYEIEYKSFDEGDFGSLEQVEFNNDKRGGNIDFWGLGQLGIFIWDYEKEAEILNIFLNPDQEEEKKEYLDKLKELL